MLNQPDPYLSSAIRVEQVSFRYPPASSGVAACVLEKLSFGIQPGERVALVGHNGCGKTTLFQLICGVLKPETGRIEVLGQPVLPGHFYPSVGFLFQDPDDQLFSASVVDDIAFGPTQMGLDPVEIEQRVQQSLRITGIQSLAQRPPHHLSGGEKQMVAMAGLLAMRPQILLCDEPTASLDLRARRRLIQFLTQTDQTLLIASHDLEFVLEVCERVILLNQGQIVADGSVKAILGDPELMEQHGLEIPYSLANQA